MERGLMSETIIQRPIGTPLYFVPIRYWEAEPIETGTVALHIGVEDEIWDSFTKDGFVYAYHNDYGHEVYMRAADTFLTVEAAMEERDRRTLARKIEQEAELEAFMLRVFPDHR
jgi:hypothetical protein